MTENQQIIENIAGMIREDMHLTLPITSEKLLKGLEEFGIKTTPVKGFIDDLNSIKRLGPLDYEIIYNPDWTEQRLAWHLANSLGHIMLEYIPGDREKDIYTGNVTCLDNHGFETDIANYFRPNKDIQHDILCCSDSDDLWKLIRNNLIRHENYEHSIRLLYDFYNETMFRITCHSITESTFFLKFNKKQQN